MLRLLIKTNLLISNRESGNAVLSYLAYILGGAVLSFIAIAPILDPSNKQTAGFFGMFTMFVVFLDYMSMQLRLNFVTLVESQALDLFPISRIRSTCMRFITFLTENRFLFYAIPLLAVLLVLLKNGNITRLFANVLIFMLFYVIISEILFAVFPIFRKLADHFSAKTVTEASLLALAFAFILLSTFHGTNENVPLPIISDFMKAMEGVAVSHMPDIFTPLSRLVLIAVAFPFVYLSGDSLISKFALYVSHGTAGKLATQVVSSENRAIYAIPRKRKNEISEPRLVSGRATAKRERSLFNLCFTDWRIRQKEEKAFYIVPMYAYLAVALMQIISRQLHQPIVSPIFAIFFVTLMLGIVLTENQLTQHGLQLKHLSIFPYGRTKFIYMKSFATWSIISTVNVILCFILEIKFHIGAYHLFQGIIYSLFQPLALIILVNTLILQLNSLYRVSIISLIIIIFGEIFATIIYVLLMSLNITVGVLFVIGLFITTYFLLVPTWGRRLSLEFQNLLEDSK